MSDGVRRALDFNISHSGSHALVAIAADRRVGVDIEISNHAFDWRSLANTVFSGRDDVYVNSLPDTLRHDGFYRIWTAKEAFLKAVGTGLAGGRTHFSVVGGEGGEPVAARCDRTEEGIESAAWDVAAFDVGW
ncbi:4'-phosphopantetheinyl transferase family protein [Trinickia sp. YCB016]